MISSAFLVSTIPRIEGVPGLSWAPARPNFPLSHQNESIGQVYSTLSGFEERGMVTHLGFGCHWMICDLADLSRARSGLQSARNLGSSIRRSIKPTEILGDEKVKYERKLEYYKSMAMLPSTTRERLVDLAKDTNLAYETLSILLPAEDTDVDHRVLDGFVEQIGLVVVVEGFHDERYRGHMGDLKAYRWKGVGKWDPRLPLPPFLRKYLYIW
jgi:hypothetical protein